MKKIISSEQLMKKMINYGTSLNIHQFKEIITQSHPNVFGFYKTTPIMHVLKHNFSQNLHFSSDELYLLMLKSNLEFQDSYHKTAIYYAFRYNQEQHLFFKPHQLLSLILTQQPQKILNDLLKSTFIDHDIFFHPIFIKIWNKIDNQNQEKIFKKFVQIYFSKNNHFSYSCKKTNLCFLLYHCQFKPLQKTINWLKKINTLKSLE